MNEVDEGTHVHDSSARSYLLLFNLICSWELFLSCNQVHDFCINLIGQKYFILVLEFISLTTDDKLEEKPRNLKFVYAENK